MGGTSLGTASSVATMIEEQVQLPWQMGKCDIRPLGNTRVVYFWANLEHDNLPKQNLKHWCPIANRTHVVTLPANHLNILDDQKSIRIVALNVEMNLCDTDCQAELETLNVH